MVKKRLNNQLMAVFDKKAARQIRAYTLQWFLSDK